MADISADLSIEDLPDQVSFDDAIIERLFNDELEKLRDIITPREFDVLKSHYIDGEPYQQVADRLGLTKNLVYVTAHRAKRKLEDYLNKNSKE